MTGLSLKRIMKTLIIKSSAPAGVRPSCGDKDGRNDTMPSAVSVVYLQSEGW